MSQHGGNSSISSLAVVFGSMTSEATPLLSNSITVNTANNNNDGIAANKDQQVDLYSRGDYSTSLSHLLNRHDFVKNLAAGITVSLINIPLSIALALASSSSPQAGIITAIWAGFVTAILGGSEYNILGPTGALSGILSRTVLLYHNDPQILPVLALTSGILIFLVYLLKLEEYCNYIPSSVIIGFSLGVAIILSAGQINNIFNIHNAVQHEQFIMNIYESIQNIFAGPVDWQSFLVFLISWVTLYSLIQYNRKVPWSIFIALFGIILGYICSNYEIGFKLITLRDRYGALEVQLWDFSYFPDLAAVYHISNLSNIISASLSIAFVSLLESLLSGRIADQMKNQHDFNPRQEALSVAAANLLTGLFGGIPATAALARTALNIRTGATSRLACLINALSTLGISFLAMNSFSYLPFPIIAALLVQVSVGMIESKHLVKAFQVDLTSFWLSIVVAISCVLFDPTVGLILGAIVGLLRFVHNMAVGFSEITISENLASHRATKVDLSLIDNAGNNAFSPVDAAVIIYRVVGELSYISCHHHEERLRKICSEFHCKYIILSFRYCYYVDIDGLESLNHCIEQLESEKISKVLLAGISNSLINLFNRCDWFISLRNNTARPHIFEFIEDAVEHLRRKYGEKLVVLGGMSNAESVRISPAARDAVRLNSRRNSWENERALASQLPSD
jgi:MFS superfamily sulfate permease-like transporter